MSANLRLKVGYYVAQVRSIPLYDDWHEVSNVFVTRDGIEDELMETPAIGDDLAAMLERADAELVTHQERLARDFPAAFEVALDVPRRYWWWHLDEGPHVRKQTPQATRTASAG